MVTGIVGVDMSHCVRAMSCPCRACVCALLPLLVPFVRCASTPFTNVMSIACDWGNLLLTP